MINTMTENYVYGLACYDLQTVAPLSDDCNRINAMCIPEVVKQIETIVRPPGGDSRRRSTVVNKPSDPIPNMQSLSNRQPSTSTVNSHITDLSEETSTTSESGRGAATGGRGAAIAGRGAAIAGRGAAAGGRGGLVISVDDTEDGDGESDTSSESSSELDSKRNSRPAGRGGVGRGGAGRGHEEQAETNTSLDIIAEMRRRSVEMMEAKVKNDMLACVATVAIVKSTLGDKAAKEYALYLKTASAPAPIPAPVPIQMPIPIAEPVPTSGRLTALAKRQAAAEAANKRKVQENMLTGRAKLSDIATLFGHEEADRYAQMKDNGEFNIVVDDQSPRDMEIPQKPLSVMEQLSIQLQQKRRICEEKRQAAAEAAKTKKVKEDMLTGRAKISDIATLFGHKEADRYAQMKDDGEFNIVVEEEGMVTESNEDDSCSFKQKRKARDESRADRRKSGKLSSKKRRVEQDMLTGVAQIKDVAAFFGIEAADNYIMKKENGDFECSDEEVDDDYGRSISKKSRRHSQRPLDVDNVDEEEDDRWRSLNKQSRRHSQIPESLSHSPGRERNRETFAPTQPPRSSAIQHAQALALMAHHDAMYALSRSGTYNR